MYAYYLKVQDCDWIGDIVQATLWAGSGLHLQSVAIASIGLWANSKFGILHRYGADIEKYFLKLTY